MLTSGCCGKKKSQKNLKPKCETFPKRLICVLGVCVLKKPSSGISALRTVCWNDTWSETTRRQEVKRLNRRRPGVDHSSKS